VVDTASVPWIEAKLRGQRVLARAHPDRSFVVEDGRVEIRYRQEDGRAYRAYARNLEVADESPLLDDSACVPVASLLTARESRGSVAAGHPSMRSWTAYTDGACSGNPGPAGSGVVLVAPDGKMYEGLEYLGQATNNVAELTAILRALEWLPAGIPNVLVYTDSQYAIGVLQKGWKAKANQELVLRTRELLRARGATLRYVPGHQGVPLNERADELAREAIESRRTRPALATASGG
jgi:ribonuclease HI